MKLKALSVVSSALFLSLAMVPIASAQEGRVTNLGTTGDVQVQVEVETVNSKGERGRAVAASERTEADDEALESNDDSASGREDNDRLSGEEHKSEVAAFVRSLLGVADREGGIGEKVRTVARSQEHSASTTAEAIEKVKSREGIRAFLFGSDYRNLGRLRSEIATTTANIRQLENLLDKAVSDSDKAEISAQIQVLEDAQDKVEAFVKARESAFSVFGWFTKLFAQ